MEQRFCNEWSSNVFDMLESNPSIDKYELEDYGAIMTKQMYSKKRNKGIFHMSDIIANKNLTFEQKLRWIKKYSTYADDYIEDLCKSDFISYDYIFAHPKMTWNETIISANPKLTMEIILQKPTDYWDWDAISGFTKIPIEDIIANLDLPWNWTKLTKNENISNDDIFANKNLPWNWNVLCRIYDMELHHIENNPELPWNWEDMDSNKHITLEFVENNMDKPWGWEFLQKNPIITIDFMLKHKDKDWDWSWLNGETGLERQQQYMEHMMVTVMLTTIYEQQTHNDGKKTINFRRACVDIVFADEYIVSRITRY